MKLNINNKILYTPLSRLYTFLLILVITGAGCKQFLTIPLPSNKIAGSAAFANDGAASAVLNNVYGKLISVGYFVDGSSSAGYLYGLYGDELQNGSTIGATNPAFYTDAVQSANTGPFWTNLYLQLYAVNATIEGVKGNTNLVYQKQWLGEAYFLRALIYFYLTNFYGDVPIVTSTSYTTNNVLGRNPAASVYQQIITDLKQSQSLLTNSYHDANGVVTTDRARPNKTAATALLARVYLYTSDWPNAEAQADSVISNTAYQLAPLSQVFLKSSQEAIWGLAPMAPTYYISDAIDYIIANGSTPIQALGSNGAITLSKLLINAFEPNDARFTNWIGVSNVAASGSTPAASYYYAYKYKTKTTGTAPVEYAMVLRLGEIYLIRAEARAQQNNLLGANSASTDLNAIRTRATLPATTAANKTDMLTAILHERQVELFTESGHRFLDLRRTGNLDAVMNIVAPQKGGVWASFKQWWPIPTTDIQVNPNLTQTPGYQQ